MTRRSGWFGSGSGVKRGNRQIECSRCGRKFTDIYDIGERSIRDLPWGEFRNTVFIEIYRVKCPKCGVKREKETLDEFFRIQLSDRQR